MTTANIAKLIKFIESHDMNTAFDNGDGTLTVTSVECRNGVACDAISRIQATFEAARDHLGY
jgi:hypothetical protein